MERTIEDKIRRAEERYYSKREQEIPRLKKTEKTGKDIKLFRKMIVQIVVCLAIYGIFNLIISNNYIFSEDFTNKVKEILAQDINFSEIYSIISNKINEILKKEEKIPEEQTENIQNNDENIGGAEEILTNEEPNLDNQPIQAQSEEQPQLTQMEQDSNYIKNNISFVQPITGRITSVFGMREPTTPTVPKNHTGIDIAAEIGTKIVSATEGTVILASSQGDYGNHLKIQNNDVIIVYAHCNKLYVKQGDVIAQGQEIAEVGSTGNTTGPHLHFEVRYQNRYVNPQMILTF